MPFKFNVKARMLARCERFCCLCHRRCGTNMEVAHIVAEADGGPCDEANGIPLCMDCHTEISHYDPRQPKGNRFSPGELVTRRDHTYAMVSDGILQAGVSAAMSQLTPVPQRSVSKKAKPVPSRRGVGARAARGGRERGGVDRFAPSIVERMAELKRTVERLTADQVQVLHSLRYHHQALIAGCAGSGKTLLTAEKAIRLDTAGLRTIVLCHSPLLADHITSLVRTSNVHVYSFHNLVRQLAGIPSPTDISWSALDEPTEDELTRAFDGISSVHSYEAVIVDEGQDFRELWWTLVDALLRRSKSKTLYIFHDDNQSLLPHRGVYPVSTMAFSMSRNCRNGGDIFDIVRRFHRDAPLASMFLAGTGTARVTPFDGQEHRVRLEEALIEAYRHAEHRQIRVLTAEVSAEESVINGFEFVSQPERSWRLAVTADLRAMYSKALRRIDELRSGNSYSEILNRFSIPLDERIEDFLSPPVLSQEAIPTGQDIDSVRRFAGRILLFFEGEQNREVGFAMRGRRLCLKGKKHTGRDTAVNIASKAAFYSRRDWTATLIQGAPMILRAQGNSSSPPFAMDYVPLYTIDAFKGLECDAVVLFVNSVTPGLLREMYVGASRAIGYLNIVIARPALSRLITLSDFEARPARR